MPDSSAVEQLGTLIGGLQAIDLTHPLRPGMPKWPTHASYEHELVECYTKGDAARHFRLALSEHSGTHLDAPAHFVADAASILDHPLDTLFGRAARIEATDVPAGKELDRDRIRQWEQENGRLDVDDAVLVRFGWDERWPAGGDFAQWPALSLPAAEYLVDVGVRLVATDACSPDLPGSDNPVHHKLLGNGVLIGENFCRLGELPAWSYLITLPLPIHDGSGSPVRAIAFA
ncbi:cyclase family protein [Fodinicola acaciae]|uniref:cyclase family protein n=1 Tax=Fodinicola acaciae TaxID=2681555 RepID=UPI0013D094E8|nr:cyclase family protein [Fodinicola acaciae]